VARQRTWRLRSHLARAPKISKKQNGRLERRKKEQRRSRNGKSDRIEKERKISTRYRFKWLIIYINAYISSIKI
jgi:hypothetical protein